MRPPLSMVLALFAALAGLVAPAAEEKKPSETKIARSLSVATFNILYLNRDLAALAATIRQANPDLIALQETNAESERYLRSHLGTEYPHIFFRPSKDKSNGFGFLSRLPLGEAEFLGAAPDGRGGWMVETRLGATQVRVISVHLTTPRLLGERPVTELIKAFGECEQIHRQELKPILGRITPGRPTIILGDFNSFSFGAAVTTLVERGLIDSFASVTPNPEQHGTWRSSALPALNQHAAVRLDYVLHDASFKTLSSRVLKSTASDHAMVISKLEFVEP